MLIQVNFYIEQNTLAKVRINEMYKINYFRNKVEINKDRIYSNFCI